MAKPTLMVVDDDQHVLRAVASDLTRRHGGRYRVLPAGLATP